MRKVAKIAGVLVILSILSILSMLNFKCLQYGKNFIAQKDIILTEIHDMIRNEKKLSENQEVYCIRYDGEYYYFLNRNDYNNLSNAKKIRNLDIEEAIDNYIIFCDNGFKYDFVTYIDIGCIIVIIIFGSKYLLKDG